MVTDSEELIGKVRNFLVKNERVQLGLIFGSFARGKSNLNSDIDLGIAYKEPLSFDEKLELSSQLSKITKREVDIIDLRTVEGLLLQQILNHRRTLVKRDPELMGNLIAKRITEEWDFMPLLDMMLQKRRARFIGGQKSH